MGNPNMEDDKGEISHLEGGRQAVFDTPELSANNRALIINENLVRAENEDKVTPYLVFLISIAAIAGFLFGYDTGIVGSAMPLVGLDLGKKLTDQDLEIIISATTIGAIPGALVLGYLADRIGRKWSMVIADIAFTLGAILIATSFSIPQIIIGRLVLGVGVGGAAVIAPLYIAELAPTAVRGRCVGANAFFIPFGQTVASAVGAGFLNVPHGWRYLFGLGVVPSLVQLALMHWLPESPRVMVTRGNRTEATAVLRKIYSQATEEVIQLKLQIIDANIVETTRLNREYTFWQRNKLLWTNKAYRRAIIAVCGMQAFGQLTGYNSLLYYSGTIFGLLGFENPSAASLIVSGGNAFFVLIGMAIVDKVGRRKLVIIAVPFLIFGQVWAAIAFHYLTIPTNGILVAGYTYNPQIAGVLLGAIVCFVAFFGISLSHVIWYQSEFLALEIRAAGSALATTSCWLANLVIAVSYLSLMSAITPTGTYGLYAGFCIIGYTFTVFCYPETKNISVDETQEIFLEGFGVKKAGEMRREKERVAKELRDGAA